MSDSICLKMFPLSVQVAEATNLRHINVGDWVKEQDLHSGYDAEFDSYIIDEDKVARSRWLCMLTITSRRFWRHDIFCQCEVPVQCGRHERHWVGETRAGSCFDSRDLVLWVLHRCAMQWRITWRRAITS